MSQYVVSGSSLHKLSAVVITPAGTVSAIEPVAAETAATHYLTTEIIVVTADSAAIGLRRHAETLAEYAARLARSELPDGKYAFAASFAVRQLT